MEELAKAEKYRMEFINRQGDTCQVQFHFEGWTGGVTYLTAAAKPFTLQEYNDGDNLFKPYRAQQATINIIGNANGVVIDNFIADNDDDILVIFSYAGFSPYWYGYVLQDNSQETWQDTNHILTIVATEAFGQLAVKEFGNNNNEVIGRITPYTAIQYCMQETPINFTKVGIINSLYHSSMNDGSTDFCLDQCYIDARTFQKQGRTYDDKLTALSKINQSFGQTIFQYEGKWWILRLEDLYRSSNLNLRGVNINTLNITPRTAINTRYDIDVAVGEEVQPIQPSIIRFINRRTKVDKVTNNFEPFDEVIENSSFSRGTVVSENANIKLFTLPNFQLQQGSFSSPTLPARLTGVNELYTDNTLRERFAFFRLDNTVNSWIKSDPTDIRLLESITLSFDFKYNYYPPSKKDLPIAYILYETALGCLALNSEGKWVNCQNDFSDAVPITFTINDTKEIYADEWNSITVTSDPMQNDGRIWMVFYGEDKKGYVDNSFNIKNFSLQTIPVFNGELFKANLTGQEAKFTKTDKLRNETDNPLYFDDNFSFTWKGTIYESDGETITNSEWYRYRYDTEIYPFRRENLLGYYQFNRYNRNRFDCTFYGLKYNGGTDPIGLLNTIIFTDDDPSKVYYIANMKEIDFDSCIWQATLIEVFDNDKDPGESLNKNFQANITTGSYSSQQYAPWTIISAADFTLGGFTNITYNGTEAIEVDIACNIAGAITSSGDSPVEFRLELNGVPISSGQVYVNNNPEYFNVDLSVNNIIIDPTDILTIFIDTDIYSLDLTGGSISFNYTMNVGPTYDTYSQRFLTN